MTKKYRIDKKEKLVSKINKLTKKEDFIKIYNIIQEKEQKPIKEIGDSTMMFFHDLKYETYEAIDKYLKDTSKTRKNQNLDQSAGENTEYLPYSQDEFPNQKSMSPKLKYSNRERNLIKRKRYDQTLMEENGSDVIYCKFNVENVTDTDVHTTDNENNTINTEVKKHVNKHNYLEENSSDTESITNETNKSYKKKKEKKASIL